MSIKLTTSTLKSSKPTDLKPQKRPAASLVLSLSSFLLFFWLVLGSFSGPAMAVTCDPTDNDILAANMTITRVNSRIDRMETSIVQTLKLHAGQISAYITQQTTAIGRMFDAQNQSNAQIAREQAKIRATRDFVPSANACETVSGVIGVQAARNHAEATATQATRAQVGRLTNSAGTPSANGQAQDTAIRWNRRMETWCSPADIVDGNQVCSGLSDNHNADINPGSLFAKKTLTTALEQQAARDFIANLIVPLAPDPLPLQDTTSDEDRRRHIKRLAAQSRLALATSALNTPYADRLASVNLGTWARAMVPERADIPDNISWKELSSILMRERYENPNYHISLQAMEPENVQREMAGQQALMLSLLFKISETIELQTAIAATQLAMAAEKDLHGSPLYPGTESATNSGTTPVTGSASE